MRRRALLACLAAVACLAQSELPREVVLLARIKRQMAQNLARIPNYTCLETIERSRRPDARRSLQVVDTVRLEVAVVGKKELYSWPEAEKFEEQDVAAIVTGGLISSGDFAMHARTVFATASPMFTYHGIEERDGRRVLRYDFRIPLMASGWHIAYGTQEGRVGSRGSFWVDEQTLDVLRLEVHGDQIPPELPVAEVFTHIDYGKVRIGTADVLLPQRAEVQMAGLLGNASHNRIEFTHCRQYLGESFVSFGPPVAPEATTTRRITELKLPAGLDVPLELETAIDSEKARVGDLVAARVRTDIRRKGELVVPQGALLKGRLRRLERHSDQGEYFIVGLEFLQLEFAEKRAGFYGQLLEIGPLGGLSRELVTRHRVKTSLGRYQRWAEGASSERITPQELPGVGTFIMRGRRFQLPAGLRMVWRTQELKR